MLSQIDIAGAVSIWHYFSIAGKLKKVLYFNQHIKLPLGFDYNIIRHIIKRMIFQNAGKIY